MHIACGICSSSDGRYVYPDGSSFCFVCRTRRGGKTSPYVLAREQPEESDMSLPHDANTQYPKHVLDWVGKYDVSATELEERNVKYSKQRDQLIFTWGPDTSKPSLWQARNFSKAAKAKCYTRGNPEEHLPILRGRHLAPPAGHLRDTTREAGMPPLVLVEDPISAIKLARFCDAMPVLGSDLSLKKLTRLVTEIRPAKVLVWLDGNMFPKAQRMASRLKLLGVDATAIYTEEDPKFYDNMFLQCMIQQEML